MKWDTPPPVEGSYDPTCLLHELSQPHTDLHSLLLESRHHLFGEEF
jgi:hypothetical protein